jgi:hypothetical protein
MILFINRYNLIEEARRESETSAPSADEGEDKDLNSSTEEVAPGSGKVKQLARRFENKNNAKESSPFTPRKEVIVEPVLLSPPTTRRSQQQDSAPVVSVQPQPELPPVQAQQPLKSTRQRQLEKLARTAEVVKLSPEKQTLPEMVEKVIDQKPEEPKQESPASSRSSSRSSSRYVELY